MNILFITATRLGDALLSTAALRILLTRYPDAHITIAAGPLATPLFEGVPGLVRTIPLTKQSGGRHWLRLWATCVTTRWDLVVDLRGSLLSYALWAKERIIWTKRKGSFGHRVKALNRLLNHKGRFMAPRLWPSAQHKAAAAARAHGLPLPVLAIAPLAHWPGKTWALERFGALSERMTWPHGPFKSVVWLGAPHEHDQIETLMRNLSLAVPTHNWAGKMDLLTLYSALKHVSFFVGNDSGLMHLAAAAGAPTLGLFGPSRETVYGPWGGHVIRTTASYEGLTSQPGFDWNARTSYMESLTVDAVEARIRKILGGSKWPSDFSK